MMKKAGAAFLLAATAWSLGVFVFDLGLVVFRRVGPDGSDVFTNAAGLGPGLLYALLALAGLVLLSLSGGVLWARKNGQRAGEGFVRQAWTFAPALALIFGRLAEGRAVHFILPIPLLPMLLLAVLFPIVLLNLELHGKFRAGSLVSFSDEESRKRFAGRAWTAGLVLIVLHILTLNPFFSRYSSYMIFAGDEPKYVRMASSLAEDGDLDLTNNFTGNDLEVAEQIRAARAAGTRAVGDYTIIGRDGGLYHFHMPGISALILPAYLLDLKANPRDIPNTQPLMFLPARMTFTRAWLIVLAVVFFLLIARFYDRLFSSRFLAALLLLALLAATRVPEFFLQVYPETAAGICLFLGLNALLFPFARAWKNRAALIAGIGFLPWLHQRFIPVALSLFVLFLFLNRKVKGRGKNVLAVSLPLAAIGFGYAVYFYRITGNPFPWSMYSLWGTSYTRAAIFPSGFFGYVFDTRSGLLAMFPVLLFALIGLFWGFKRERRTAALLLAVILPYFCLIAITPWHGIEWETTRMSLILVPLFLVFAGFAFRSLRDKTSPLHLLFYGAALAFLLLNKDGRYWEISLGNVLIQPHQVGYIIQSAVVLILFFAALWVLDRLTPKPFRPLPLAAWDSKIKSAWGKIRRAAVRPAVRKALAGLLLSVPVLYGCVYLRNWDDRSLASTYFTGLAKVRRFPDIRLALHGRPDSGLAKNDKGFADLLPRDAAFRLEPGQTSQSFRFGPTPFLERCPAGRYWISLEFIDAPADFNAMYLDFAGETDKVLLDAREGTKSSSVTRLFFEDLFISPEIRLRFAGPVSRAIKGRLRFAPIPCYVFDRRLILMPGDDYSPRPLRTVGPRSYLTLTAIARDPVSDFAFDISLPESAAGGDERSRILGSYPLGLGKMQGRRFNIPLDFSGPTPPDGAALALSVSEGGRRLRARSVSFPAGDVIRLGLMPQFQGGQLPVRETAASESDGRDVIVSFDRIRVEFSTTADWARMEWLNQRDVLAVRVMSVPGEDAAGWSATADFLGLGQPGEHVGSGRRITLVADYAVASEARGQPLEFQLQRGSINDSRLRVSRVDREGETLLAHIDHAGIEEDDSGLNSLYVAVDTKILRDEPFSRAPLGPGEGEPVRWEFLEEIPAPGENALLLVREAEARGVDGFFLPWPGEGEASAAILDRLFEAAASEKFAISFYFNPAVTGGGPPPDEDRMGRVLAAAAERYGQRPAILKADGRPVFAVPVAGPFSLEAWVRTFGGMSGRGIRAAALAFGLAKSEFERFIDLDEGRPFLYPGPENPGPHFVRRAGAYSLLRDTDLSPVWITTVLPLIKWTDGAYRLVWDLKY